MNWRMIAKPLATADMSGIPTISQRFKADSDCLLKACTVGVVFYNDPAFTNLYLEVWSDRSSAPSKLIATSAVVAKANILLVEDHAYKILGLTFSNAFPIKSGAYYHAVLKASAYTGNSGSHIAWRSSYPDPQYQTNVTMNAASADNHPFEITFITSDI